MDLDLADSISCCCAPSDYCKRCELLSGLPGLYAVGVLRDDAGLRVEVGSARLEVMGCPACGVIARMAGRGYRCAIDDQLDDAIAVLDAFHAVKLDTATVDKVRRQVQQTIHGHRGRRDDPLYRIRNLLHAGKEHLTDRQKTRLKTAASREVP